VLAVQVVLDERGQLLDHGELGGGHLHWIANGGGGRANPISIRQEQTAAEETLAYPRRNCAIGKGKQLPKFEQGKLGFREGIGGKPWPEAKEARAWTPWREPGIKQR
jgi:hypothetical protein